MSDNPAEEIVKYAAEHDVGLIVMGTHGRGAMAQLLVGSVAEKVVRTAPCPVLTVRHPEPPAIRPRYHRRNRTRHRRLVMITLKNILVATDFSEPSDAALIYGRALARTFKAHAARRARRRHRVERRLRRRSVCGVDPGTAAGDRRFGAQAARPSCSSTTTRRPLPTRRVLLTSHAPAAAIVDYAGRERDRPDRDRHARPRRRGTLADGQRRRTGRPDRAVPGADRPPSGT